VRAGVRRKRSSNLEEVVQFSLVSEVCENFARLLEGEKRVPLFVIDEQTISCGILCHIETVVQEVVRN
jgi:hypothetical protein